MAGLRDLQGEIRIVNISTRKIVNSQQFLRIYIESSGNTIGPLTFLQWISVGSRTRGYRTKLCSTHGKSRGHRGGWIKATSGVGVSVTTWGVVPSRVFCGTTPGADVPVHARDVPVAKICTSVILPGVAVPNKLSELIGVLVTLGGCEYGWLHAEAMVETSTRMGAIITPSFDTCHGHLLNLQQEEKFQR